MGNFEKKKKRNQEKNVNLHKNFGKKSGLFFKFY